MDIIRIGTENAMKHGRNILQFYLFGKDEKSHADYLLKLLDPIQNASILDIGCGTGELTRLWSQERPDLKFTLVNNHEWQLSLCDGETVLADMHKTGIDKKFDVVMVNYAIGYARIDEFLAECKRLLKDDGFLFICDIAGESSLLGELNYQGYTPKNFMEI